MTLKEIFKNETKTYEKEFEKDYFFLNSYIEWLEKQVIDSRCCGNCDKRNKLGICKYLNISSSEDYCLNWQFDELVNEERLIKGV